MRSKLTGYVAMALAITVAAALCGCSKQRSEQHRLKGDAYLKIGKADEAMEAYQKAELANPNNAMAQVGLGRCHIARGQFAEAIAAFDKAAAIDPKSEAAYAQGLYAHLKQDDVEGALALAARLETVNPERAGLYRAFVLMRTGRSDEALPVLEELRDRFPNNAEIRVMLSSSLLLANRVDDAEKQLRHVLDADPKSAAARLALADVLNAQNKTGEMVAELRELVQQNPQEPGPQLGLARGLLLAGQPDEAEQIARDLITKNMATGWANFIMGGALLQKQQFTQAIPYLEAADAELLNYPPVAQALALAKSGKSAPAPVAAAASAPAAPAQPSDWKALWQQGALLQLLQQADTILALDEPNARETLAIAALLTNRVTMAGEIAAPLPAESPLRQYVDALKAKDLSAAMKVLDAWKEQDEARQILHENLLGHTLAVAGARAQAIHVFSRALDSWPENAASLFNIAQVCRQAGMPEFAAQALRRLLRQYPNNVDVLTMLYGVYRESDMPTEARTAAEMMYAQFPQSREAILELSQAYLDAHDLASAQNLLNQAIQASPGDPALQVALASLLLAMGKLEDVRTLVGQIAAPPELAQRVALLDALGSALSGKWEDVAAKTEAMTGPKTPAARMLAVTAALRTGASEKAAATLEALPKPLPIENILLASLGKKVSVPAADAAFAAALSGKTDLQAQLALAFACQASRLHDTAHAILRELCAKTGPHPSLLQLLFASIAEAHVLPDRVAEARAVADEYKDSADAQVGLARVLQQAGDIKGEQAALEKAAALAPKDPVVLMQLAAFHDQHKDFSAQIPYYRQMLEAAPDDPVANNNLAYCLLMTDGDVQEALQRASKAVEALKSNAVAFHTLGVAQLRAGDLENSKKHLSYALELRPGDPTMLLDFGQLLITMGQANEGRMQLQLALKYTEQLGLDFPRKDEAQALLDKTPAAAEAAKN